MRGVPRCFKALRNRLCASSSHFGPDRVERDPPPRAGLSADPGAVASASAAAAASCLAVGKAGGTAPLGRTRAYLTYKSRRAGIRVPGLQDEVFTTTTCPTPGCGARNRPTSRYYRCKRCGLIAHRDGVGAWNIRAKHLGIDPWGKTPADPSRVVGAVAAPTGVRYRSQMRAGPAESGVAVPDVQAG